MTPFQILGFHFSPFSLSAWWNAKLLFQARLESHRELRSEKVKKLGSSVCSSPLFFFFFFDPKNIIIHLYLTLVREPVFMVHGGKMWLSFLDNRMICLSAAQIRKDPPLIWIPNTSIDYLSTRYYYITTVIYIYVDPTPGLIFPTLRNGYISYELNRRKENAPAKTKSKLIVRCKMNIGILRLITDQVSPFFIIWLYPWRVSIYYVWRPYTTTIYM